jgi:hypothetical protein
MADAFHRAAEARHVAERPDARAAVPPSVPAPAGVAEAPGAAVPLLAVVPVAPRGEELSDVPGQVGVQEPPVAGAEPLHAVAEPHDALEVVPGAVRAHSALEPPDAVAGPAAPASPDEVPVEAEREPSAGAFELAVQVQCVEAAASDWVRSDLVHSAWVHLGWAHSRGRENQD